MTDTPQTFVILGANGDLTERLLLPGIASYRATGAVDQPLKIIGSGRHANDEFPQTVREVFEHKVGVRPTEVTPPRLLRLFDAPDRDDRTWAISVAYSVSMPELELTGAKGELLPVDEVAAATGRDMLWDHDEIVSAAVESLRERYEFRFRNDSPPPDPDGFLPEPFTLHQLRKVHEAVIGEELHKDNFARRMKPQLTPVTRGGEVVRSAAQRGRPATLYRIA